MEEATEPSFDKVSLWVVPLLAVRVGISLPVLPVLLLRDVGQQVATFFFFTILTDGFVLQNILSLKTKTTESNSISLSMPEWVFRWKGLPVIKKKNHACIFTSL